MKLRRSLFAAALFALVVSTVAHAEGVLIPLKENGPRAKRINVVVLAEGYTAAEQAKFQADAAIVVNYMFSAQFYKEYEPYFNSYLIFVASNQSGADNPSKGVTRDTYFNSTYGSFGIQRLLTIPFGAEGEGKANALLEQLLPEFDIPIVLVNDLEYGGSGGSIAVCSVNTSAPEILVHEVGHSFVDLADEYDDFAAGYPDIEKANSTRETDRAAIKWNYFISADTPIPTPETVANNARIGLFEGAYYHATGWYRPKLDCKMNHLDVPFCEVCVEASIKSIYKIVSPIESVTPAVTDLNLSGSGTQQLEVTTLQPVTGTFAVQWSVGGVPVPGATQKTFTVGAPALGDGSHSVSVAVTDGTTLVVSDPDKLLRGSQTFNVTVANAVPGFTSALALTRVINSQFSYQLAAKSNPTSLNATGLPPFLTFNPATGIISGTLTDVGVYPITLSATNANGTGTATLTLTVIPPNDDPIIESEAVATPNPAPAGGTVTFTVVASDANGDTLTYNWEFGDGGSGSGATVTHVYATEGFYTATVQISDSKTTSSSQTIVQIGKPLTVEKLQLGLNFAKALKDTAKSQGSIPLPLNANVAAKSVQVDVGGAGASFTLDTKGKAKGALGTVSLKNTRGVWKFTLSLSKGTFAPQWTDEGLVNATTAASVVMPVTIRVDGTPYIGSRPLAYSAKAGKTGKAK